MSVEAILHPISGTKKELKDFLLALGYRPCKSLWDWPKGSLTFHWFDHTDFLSFDGVEATIYPPNDDRHSLGACSWAIHTRTRSSGSRADKVHQNATIRKARALFGGNFYNDWGGKNRYSAERPEHRDAAARGLYMLYERVTDHLNAVRFSLPEEHEGMARLAGVPELADLARNDPTRVLYNALVPFAVASLEGFLGDAFTILIRYSPKAQKRLAEQDKKIGFEDAIAISRGDRSLEDVIASWYSFQNVSSIQKAFDEWLGIDFRTVLRGTRAAGRKGQTLDDALTDLIAFRHRVIHSFELEYSLRRDRITRTLQDAQDVIDAFVDHLETGKGMIIRDETLYALEAKAEKQK